MAIKEKTSRSKPKKSNKAHTRLVEDSLLLFKRFVETSGQALGMADLEGRIFYANATLCRLLGEEKPHDLYQKDVFDFYTPEAVKQLREEILPTVLRDGQWSGELALIDVKHRPTPTIHNIFLIRDDSNAPLYIASVITEILKRLRMEEKIVTDRDQLAKQVFEHSEELEKSNMALQLEIAERKELNEALRKSELAFRRLFEATPVGTGLLLNRKTVKVNPALCRITGYSPEEIEGQSVRIAYRDDEEFERVGKILFEQIAQNGMGIAEAHLRLKNGAEVEALVCSSPLDPLDPSAGVVASVIDITDRKRAEAQLERNLRETRVRFEISQALAGKETEDEVLDVLIQQANLYPQAHVSIVTFENIGGEAIGTLRRCDPFESGVTTVVPLGMRFPSSQFATVTSHAPDRSFISEDVFRDERIDPRSREIIQQGGGTSFAAFPLTSGNEWMGIITAISKTRGYFDEEKQHLYQTLAEQGSVALRAARLREKIRESQQRMSLLIEQSPLAVIEWNLNLEVVSWNPAAERIFGYTAAEALGRLAAGLVLPATDQPHLDRLIKRVVGTKDSIHVVNTHVTKNGRSIICEWFDTPLISSDGQVIGIISHVQDITERKHAEAQIERNLRETRVRLDISQALVGSESEEEVLDILFHQVNFDQQVLTSIVTFEKVGGEIMGTVRRHNPLESGFNKVLPLGTSLPASQFKSIANHAINGSFVSQDISLDERVDPRARELIQREGGISFAAFPLTAGNEWLGLVTAIAKPRGYFDEERQSLYRTLAEQGAVALRAARMRETIRESQQWFQGLVETLSDWVWEIDQNGVYTYVSPKVRDLLGYEPEEVLGKIPIDFMSPEEAQRVAGVFRPLMEAKQPLVALENTNLHKDGHPVVIETSGLPFFDAEGRYKGYRGIDRDITERKRAEETILHERDFSRAALDSMPSLFYLFNAQGRFLRWNRNFTGVSGYTDEEIARMNPMDFFTGSDRDQVNTAIREVYSTGEGLVEAHFVSKDGTSRLHLFTGKLLQFEGSPCLVGMGIDITERKRAEAQLERNLRETRVRFDVSQALMGKETEDEVLDALIQQANLYSQAGVAFCTLEMVNGERIAVLRRDESFSSGLSKLLPLGTRFPTSQFEVIDTYVVNNTFVSENVITDERVDPASRKIISQMGGTSYAVFQVKAGNDLMGMIFAMAKTSGFFDEEKQHLYQTLADQGAVALRAARLREAIRASQQRLSLIVEQSPLAIIEWNMKREVVSWNPAATRIFGYEREEALGRHALGLVLPKKAKPQLEEFIQYLLAHEEGVYNELDHVTKDKRSITCEWFSAPLIGPDGKAIGGVCLVQDITKRKQAEEEKTKLEEQLRQAQKMEAVGRLAGGVAHDFNNMLGVIIGYTNLIKTQLSADDPLRQDILEIEQAAVRSKDITAQLLAFSRKQTIAPKVLDLNDIVMRMQKTLERIIGEDIDLKFSPGNDLLKIKIDPTQIEQILVNLAANARDAISESGKLTIETANVSLDESYCTEHIGFMPGNFAMLGVSDNGVGMDKETLEHVFEPFYTTKELGKGTGLGLAMVYGIVKQNNGFINIYSELTQGTSIKIYLPRSLEEDKKAASEIAPVVHQSGTILLVEDDDKVRRMAAKMLKAIGYTVLSTEKPEQALSICEKLDQPIDLMLTDVVMPVMSGKELKDKVEVIRPGLKTIFMSGYTASVIAHRGILEEGVHLLQKPFTINELSDKILEVLGKH